MTEGARGTPLYASTVAIQTATEKVATEVTVGAGLKVNGVITPYTASKTDFAQLTAAGSTAGYDCFGCTKHAMYATIGTIDTSVTLRIESSPDNSNWHNLDADGFDTTVTANGIYLFQFDGVIKYIRGTFVSEVGGTAVTVDFDYYGVG
jgi:hypothetical protein